MTQNNQYGNFGNLVDTLAQYEVEGIQDNEIPIGKVRNEIDDIGLTLDCNIPLDSNLGYLVGEGVREYVRTNGSTNSYFHDLDKFEQQCLGEVEKGKKVSELIKMLVSTHQALGLERNETVISELNDRREKYIEQLNNRDRKYMTVMV